MRLSAGSLLFFSSPLRIPNRYTLFKPVQPLFRIKEATRPGIPRTLLAGATSCRPGHQGGLIWGPQTSAAEGEGVDRHFKGRRAADYAQNACRPPRRLGRLDCALRGIQHAGDGPPRRPAMTRDPATQSQQPAASGQSYVSSARTVWLPARLRPPPPPGAGTGGKDALRGWAGRPCVAQARLSRTRSFKLRAIINS